MENQNEIKKLINGLFLSFDAAEFSENINSAILYYAAEQSGTTVSSPEQTFDVVFSLQQLQTFVLKMEKVLEREEAEITN